MGSVHIFGIIMSGHERPGFGHVHGTLETTTHSSSCYSCYSCYTYKEGSFIAQIEVVFTHIPVANEVEDIPVANEV